MQTTEKLVLKELKRQTSALSHKRVKDRLIFFTKDISSLESEMKQIIKVEEEIHKNYHHIPVTNIFQPHNMQK